MNRIRKNGLMVVACLFVAGVLQAVPVIEEPAVLPEAMLSITASDLHGLIDGIGSVAAQVSPMMSGMMLKSMVGAQLGDPGLAGIAPGKGLAIVALDATNIFAVVEVGAAQVAAYTNALAPQGVQFKYADGLLVVGETQEEVAKGVALGGAVKSKLLAKRSPTLRIAMQPAAIIERNNEQIQGMLQMMPMMMGQGMMQSPGATLESAQSTTKILEGELRVLLSLADQCESVELVLAPKNGSVRITETFVPKAGTRLAALCNAPALNPPNAKVQSGYLGAGAIRFDSTMANPEALMEFMVAEAEQLVSEMELSDIDLPSWISLMEKWWSICGGSFSETVGFDGDMSVGYLMDVKDEAKTLALLKGMKQDFEPFLTLYEDLGMSMELEFKENVREYNGVKIHQFAVGMSMTNQPAEVAEELAAMNLTNMVYEIAITDGIVIYAMGEEKVETIIDRLADKAFKPVPLKALGVYPGDGFYYFDIDVGEYMAFVSAFIPDAEVQQMATLFQGAEPITSAGFKADGRVMWSINVPGNLLAKIGQAVMMMQMQQGGGMSQP